MFVQFPNLKPLYDELTEIHGKLWYIEDRKRQIEEGMPVESSFRKINVT